MDIFEMLRRINLQLFGGEGSGDGAGASGEASGDASVAAGREQALRDLGVPEEKIRKRAKNNTPQIPAGVVTSTQLKEQKQAAAAPVSNPTEEKPQYNWDEIMKDPEMNRRMQETVKSRLRESKDSKAMATLAPVLEKLAKSYNLDPAAHDYAALAQAINDDDQYYEDKALEMGVSVETAKRIEQMEQELQRNREREQITIEQQKARNHLIKLEEQGEALKEKFPSFDLRTELQNPVFARMTHPDVGISVQDAFYAVHRGEIEAATAKAVAEQTSQKISNAIQSGSNRPTENGTSGQSASVTNFDYRAMTRDQRNEFKKLIMQSAARGEKIYPGR